MGQTTQKYPSLDRRAQREQRADHRTWPDHHSSAIHITTDDHLIQASLSELGDRWHSICAHGLQLCPVHSSIDQLHALRSAIDLLLSTMAQYSH